MLALLAACEVGWRSAEDVRRSGWRTPAVRMLGALAAMACSAYHQALRIVKTMEPQAQEAWTPVILERIAILPSHPLRRDHDDPHP